MREFHRAIVFTKVPLSGYYLYKDIFQIFPSNLENQPASSFQTHHANILEYWTSKDDTVNVPPKFEKLKNLFSRTAITLNKQDKILALLSTFTNNYFFRYNDLTGNWGMPIYTNDPQEEANTWSSLWCMKLFHFPNLPNQLIIDKFTVLTIPEIVRLEHQTYYTFEPNLDFDSKREVVFPETIDELFDAYFLLDKETLQLIDIACSHSSSAVELRNQKNTLSLLASFTAIETMINIEFKGVPILNCDACGLPKYSIARKFREYLMTYIGKSDKNKKRFNSYYNLRSKIVHTGIQLKSEVLFADFPQEEKDQENLTLLEILQIGKLAIINWLLINKRIGRLKPETAKQ